MLALPSQMARVKGLDCCWQKQWPEQGVVCTKGAGHGENIMSLLGVAWNGTWCAVLARLAPHCWPRNWSRHSCPTAHWIECLLPWKKLQAQGGWAVARHSEFVFWTCNWIQAKEPDPWGFEQRQGKTSQYSSNLERPCSSDSSFDSIAANPDSKAFWGGTEHQVACDKLARFLAQTYASMETNDIKSLPKLGAKVAGQYMALERHALRNDSIAFHIMPKMHLFQHICECGFAPKEFWCYQDETTGFFGQAVHKERGLGQPRKNCENMFLRWQQLTSFPCVPVD